MSSLATLNAEGFDAFTASSDPIALVDFWAPWCGPCRQLMPQLDAISAEYVGRVKFGKVNVDECPELAKALQIRNIPCLLLFRDGQPIAASVGMKSPDELRSWLNTALQAKVGDANASPAQ